MTKLIAILIIASACLFAQAAAEERWEYCVVDTRLADWMNPGYKGTTRICYATEQGCKEESVILSGEQKNQTYDESEAAAVERRTFASAIAQLGKDRWELVSVTQRTSDGYRILGRTLYFKRRVR